MIEEDKYYSIKHYYLDFVRDLALGAYKLTIKRRDSIM